MCTSRIPKRIGTALVRATVFLASLASAVGQVSPVEAQEREKLYSVASIATNHPNEQTRAHFLALGNDFAKLQLAAGTNARFVFSTASQVNAFATKYRGEHLVAINAGLLSYFREDREAILAVLAHELGHVSKDHSTQGQNAQAAIQFIAGLAGLLFDINQARHGHESRVGLGEIGGAIGATLVGRAYTRDQEREADAESVSILIKAGFHPNSAQRVQERFAAASSGSAAPLLLATHPPSAERAANISKQIVASENQIATAGLTNRSAQAAQAARNSAERYEANRKLAAQLAERMALQAKADEVFAARQNAALEIEKAIAPELRDRSQRAVIAEPLGDCRNRGPSIRV